MLARVHTASSPIRERERERERKKQRDRQKEGDREKEGEGERGRCRICQELLFLFLKGMMGALAPFSYLVQYNDILK